MLPLLTFGAPKRVRGDVDVDDLLREAQAAIELPQQSDAQVSDADHEEAMQRALQGLMQLSNEWKMEAVLHMIEKLRALVRESSDPSSDPSAHSSETLPSTQSETEPESEESIIYPGQTQED